MDNNSILKQMAQLSREFKENVDKQVCQCRSMAGVTESGIACIIPSQLLVKYQTWDGAFFDRRKQIKAVQEVVGRHSTDPIGMMEAVRKMTAKKMAGDTRLNPCMLEVLHNILHETGEAA